VDEIYHHALKLLRRRDYTISQLREKMEIKFGEVPAEIIETLLQHRYLDDARYAVNLVAKRRHCHPSAVREELLRAGVSGEIIEESILNGDWLTLRDALRAKMKGWNLHAPVHQREASRLFRALARLGFPEDEIREELELIHEQQ
jgi:SOS response regulatory protein OraA/RecX